MSDLWWRIAKMKKEAKSRAAKEHRRKYETAYESTPARKKYRRELERERRKRGVAGKGGKDMSHTKEGRIVPEDPHTNRARSHPSVGSTLKMVVVKAPLHDVATGKQVAGAPQPMTDFQARDPKRNRFLPDPYEFDFKFLTDNIKAPQQYQYESPDKSTRGVVNVEDNKANIVGYATHRDKRGQGRGSRALRNLSEELRQVHPDLQEITSDDTGAAQGFWDKMREQNVVKEQKKLFVQGQKTLDGQPAFTPTDFAAEERRRQAALKEQRAREAREAQRRKVAEGNATLPLRNPE